MILDFHYDGSSNRFAGCPAGHDFHRAHYREHTDQHVLLILGCNDGPRKHAHSNIVARCDLTRCFVT